VTIIVTCYSWAPFSGDPLFACGATFWPSHMTNLRKALVIFAEAQLVIFSYFCRSSKALTVSTVTIFQQHYGVQFTMRRLHFNEP